MLSLGKALLAFDLLHFVLQGQTCLLLQLSLDFLLLHCFFDFIGWGIDLDYCDTEWFALKMNRDHSAIFETAPKYCILDSC